VRALERHTVPTANTDPPVEAGTAAAQQYDAKLLQAMQQLKAKGGFKDGYEDEETRARKKDKAAAAAAAAANADGSASEAPAHGSSGGGSNKRTQPSSPERAAADDEDGEMPTTK
jgi:hypothetical protein